MSDPRPTARETARAFVNGFWGMVEKVERARGETLVDRLTAAIAADRAASDAREDRLRNALEGARRCLAADGDARAAVYGARDIVERALGAIPPRSDR